MMVHGIKIFLNISQQPEIILGYFSPVNSITFSAQAVPLGKGDVHEQAHIS